MTRRNWLKKSELSRNGTRVVEFKTIHGRFEFEVQRFTTGQDYLSLTGQGVKGYVSERLVEYAIYYSNRLSYEEVAGLIERQTGDRLLSDQSIWRLVVGKAAEVSESQRQQVEAITRSSPHLPAITTEIDLYDPDQAEVLLFEDGIQVKEQKPTRDHQPKESRTRINTDVVLLEKPDATYHYLVAGIDETGAEIISLEQLVQARLRREYAGCQPPLPVVAITDGATAIRTSLLAIFGQPVTLILDWYHLEKKVSELFSMIALTKPEKHTHLNHILPLLWEGKTPQVLTYLGTQVQPRNPDRLQELMTYLHKHAHEIIDYQRRQQAGKSVGSGRVEKAVDQVIGRRQKDNAMSWSRLGSKALAILKVVELNQQWPSLWDFEDLAA